MATIWLLSMPQFKVDGSAAIPRISVPPFRGLPFTGPADAIPCARQSRSATNPANKKVRRSLRSVSFAEFSLIAGLTFIFSLRLCLVDCQLVAIHACHQNSDVRHVLQLVNQLA